mmetsp:Transcript_9885/g.24204  ORF Transcript_9885/g.24204 Transcript_9885/m.24204 type:complete len:487 (-) Transcript_9885:2-1462(-)
MKTSQKSEPMAAPRAASPRRGQSLRAVRDRSPARGDKGDLGRAPSPGRAGVRSMSKSRGATGEEGTEKGGTPPAKGQDAKAKLGTSLGGEPLGAAAAVAIPVATLFHRMLPCVSYASSSMYMTLAQKYVLTSGMGVKSIFLFYQNLAALVMFIPSSLGMLKRFNIEPYAFWDTRLALEVLPLGLTYSLMLYSSNLALASLSVPMVSVLKNLGPIFITLLESYTDQRRISPNLWLSMLMLFMGSFVAGFYDLKYDFYGYLAMFLNVATNVIHVNVTKRIQKRGIVKNYVALHYQSIFFMLLLFPSMIRQDFFSVINKLVREEPWDVQFAFLSTGVNGIVIALCSMWCIEATSGSTYSMVGALNKIPLAILGIFIFNDPLNLLNLSGVFLGLAGGILFSYDRYHAAIAPPAAAPPASAASFPAGGLLVRGFLSVLLFLRNELLVGTLRDDAGAGIVKDGLALHKELSLRSSRVSHNESRGATRAENSS